MQPNLLFSEEALRALCGEIGMARPETERMAALLPSVRARVAPQELAAQCSPAEAAETTQKLEQRMAALSPDGLAMLAVQLCAAQLTRQSYRQRGIAPEIFTATMGCFSRFAAECRRWYGAPHYDRAFWAWRQLSGVLFRLGTLEFELYLPDAGACANLGLTRPEQVISVHIPSDADCQTQPLHAAYAQAREFFARQYGRQFAVTCCSWLLSPALGGLLPPDSGIRRFAADYRVTGVEPEEPAYQLWLYGQLTPCPIADLPEKTSLQRRVKAHLLAGGTIGEAAGVLKL
jgi:hypothetical protein